MLDMNSFHKLTGLIFAGAGILHIGRVLLGWNLVLGEWAIPNLLSIGVGLFALWLAYNAFKLAK